MKYLNIVDNIAIAKVSTRAELDVDGYIQVTDDLFFSIVLPACVVVEDGGVVSWQTVALSEMPSLPQPEIDLDALAEEIRTQRDALLAETDWTQCLDAPIDTDSQLDYRVYRQALRDITEQTGFPLDVTWPEMPETVKADPDPIDEAVDLMLNGEEVSVDA